MTTLLTVIETYMHHASANDDHVRTIKYRSRTVPIAETITPVPNYPSKLVVYKIPASKFWHVRCFMHGRTHKQSTKTTNQRVALNAARSFYERLCLQYHADVVHAAGASSSAVKPQMTFAAIAAQMFANEHARVQRGEYSADSLQVLRNRLDAKILPYFGKLDVSLIDFSTINKFVNSFGGKFSTTTVNQYLVAIRKVFIQAKQLGCIQSLPDMPRIKVVTVSRSAFTPTEYWQIMRRARALVGEVYPYGTQYLRQHYQIMRPDSRMPPDLAWVVGFMVNSFIRPSDVKNLQHRHVEVVNNGAVQYLRLTLPESKRHSAPIVTLQPAVRTYQHMVQQRLLQGTVKPTDYLFLPHLQNRNFALKVLNVMLNWVLEDLGLKQNAHGGNRTLYSFRHSAITFRLLYGSGIDLLTLARNARTSVEMIQRFYASTVQPEQNIRMLHSKRTRM